MTESKPSSGERIHGLDAYRAVLMMLGVVLHAAEPFLEFMTASRPDLIQYQGQFNTSEGSETLIGFLYFCVRTFRMPAFFLLAGYFMALLWEQRGPKATLKNRLERIYLPFGVFILLFGLLELGDKGITPDAEGWGLLAQFFPGSTWHLWFLYTLMGLIPVVSLLAWVQGRLQLELVRSKAWLKWSFETTGPFIGIYLGLNQILMHSLRIVVAPVSGAWMPDPTTLIYYFCYFIWGWCLYAVKVDLHATKAHAGKFVLAGLFFAWLYQGVLLEDPEPMKRLNHVNCMSLALICLMRGLMGLFLRWVPTFSSGWRYASDASYWVYLSHLFIAYALPTLWMGSETPALLLYLANVALTLVICFTTYDLFVRSTFVGRFLNGRRYERGPLVWRVSGACTAVLCLGFSFQFAAAQAEIMQQNQKAEAKKWEAWEALGTQASLLPFFDALNKNIPRLGGEESGPVCMPSGRHAVCHHPRTYPQAKIGCESLGASLVVVESEEEKSHVGNIWSAFGFSNWYWIGLDKLTEPGTWLSANGESVDYTAWDSGQPGKNQNEKCVATSYEVKHAWHDFPCEAKLIFMCEFPPAPTQEVSGPFQTALNPPDGFKGTWYLSSESLAGYPAFQAAPSDEQQPTLAFIDALNLKLTFESDHVLIGLVVLDAYKEIRLPYTIANQTADTLTLAWGANSSGQMVVTRQGNTIELNDGLRQTQLLLQK